MRLKPVTTLFLLAIAFGLPMSTASGLNLQDAYRLAQQYDATYASAVANYEAAKLDLPLAKSGRRPTANVTAGVTQNHDSFSNDGAEDFSVNGRQSQLALNLNQSLYNKSTTQNIDAAEIGVEMAKLQLGLAGEALISQTVNLYLAVLSALDNQTLAELERTAIEKQLDLATQRLNVGLGTKTDQFDAKARFESANANLIIAQNEVLDSKQALEALMDKMIADPLSEELATLDNDKVNLGLQSKAYWVEAALARNRAFLIARRQVELQQVAVERAAAGRSPTLNLVAGTSAAESGANNQSPGGSQRNWNIGLQGSIPVYLGGSIKLQQRKAGYGLNAAKSLTEQARRDTDRNVRAAFRGVEALQRQVQALAEAVRASESALESKEEGFKAGVTTNLDVLDGQRDLFRARRDYLKSSYDLVNAVVQLERTAGELDGEDVARINGWLK